MKWGTNTHILYKMHAYNLFHISCCMFRNCNAVVLHALFQQIQIVWLTCFSLDREYLCLGEWEEDGLLYTYTRRTHNPRHECFVGKVKFHPLHIELFQPSFPGRKWGKDITFRRWS